MKKKTYQQPQVELFEVKAAEIICTSNEHLGEGDPIFGARARGSFYDDEDEDEY